MNERDFYLSIQSMGNSHCTDMPIEAVNILRENLDLIGCTFYVLSALENSLILKAQYGFKYDDFMSYELSIKSFAGRALTIDDAIYENDVATLNDYRDKKLLKEYGLAKAVAVPISCCLEGTCKPIGVVCCYLKASATYDEGLYRFLSSSLGKSYESSIANTKISAREKVVSAIRISSDLNSALHRTVNSLSKYLSFEACSIFLYEERSRRLQLHASTGIESDLYKHDILYSASDAISKTWQCFQKGEKIVLSFDDFNEIKNEKHRERIFTKSAASMFLPIINKSENNSNINHQGVFRCRVKILKHENIKEPVSFSYDDFLILSYVCEIISLTFHIFLHRESQISYFERVMHGTKSNVQTSIQNLELLERRGNLESSIPKSLHFAIYDTREWLEDIKNQMERIESSSNLVANIESVFLGNILINIIRLFQKSALSRGVNRPEITNLKRAGFFDLPKVQGDEKLLMLVFRNIIENALKYRKLSSNSCSVTISHLVSNEAVELTFSDDGIGIPEEDRPDVFREGFRSENAASQDPAGTGLGLSQSREAMRAMGGDLVLNSCTPVKIIVRVRRK